MAVAVALGYRTTTTSIRHAPVTILSYIMSEKRERERKMMEMGRRARVDEVQKRKSVGSLQVKKSTYCGLDNSVNARRYILLYFIFWLNIRWENMSY